MSKVESVSTDESASSQVDFRNAARGLWPRITTKHSARGAARQGAWAAIIVGLATVAPRGAALQPVNWLVAVAFLAFALGISRMSRLAAAGALLLFAGARVWIHFQHGTNLIGLAFAALVVIAFINGLRGTYAYRAITE